MKAFVLAVALVAALPTCGGATEAITGKVRVIDGDTIEVGGITVRLFGIDAPELEQHCVGRTGKSYPCGELARFNLNYWIGGLEMRCFPVGHDRYQRILAICSDNSDEDIGARLVIEGLALAFRRYSEYYVGAEDFARENKQGMWAGEFVPPWEWRALQKKR